MKKLSVLSILCTVSLFFLQNCKDKDQQPNPCAGKTLPAANFILAEKLDGEDRYFETDKIIYVNDLFLRGPEGYKTYLWQVGTNMNWSTQKNATVTFSQAEGKLRVRLIATRVPMRECFASDDGVDTIEKWIDVIPKHENNKPNSALIGEWEGTSSQFGLSDVYTIKFYAVDSSANGSKDGVLNYYLRNMLNTNCATNDYFDITGYILWSGIGRKTNCVFNYIAYTFPNNKDSIVVEYEVEGPPPTYEFIPHVFKGKRK